MSDSLLLPKEYPSSPDELLEMMQKHFKYKQSAGYTTYDQIIQHKVAQCWGAADFGMKVLDRLRIPSLIIFLSRGIVIDSDNTIIPTTDARTHAALIFKRDDEYFWFEWAWSKHEGINRPFSSSREIIDKIYNAFAEEYGGPITTRLHMSPIANHEVTEDEYLKLAFQIDSLT